MVLVSRSTIHVARDIRLSPIGRTHGHVLFVGLWSFLRLSAREKDRTGDRAPLQQPPQQPARAALLAPPRHLALPTPPIRQQPPARQER